MRQTAERYHDISCGHRVVGHENKCRFLHGHNYRVHFTCMADELDSVGRVIDFGVIKERLCMWLEEQWDHRFLAWFNDSLITALVQNSEYDGDIIESERSIFVESVVFVPFNPTAENMAAHLLNVIGPEQLKGTGVSLQAVRIEETAKCSASASFPQIQCGG